MLGRDLGPADLGTLPGGKPVLLGGALQFSVSHTGDHLAVAACTSGPVGVDVERVRRLDHPDRVARRVLGVCELRALARLPRTERELALLRAWTRKEALLKADGVGLARPMTSLEVELTGSGTYSDSLDRRDAPVARPLAHSGGRPWQLYDVALADDLVLALVSAGPARVRCHDWP